jgi:hypothetical protein
MTEEQDKPKVTTVGPNTHSRVASLPPRKPPPSKADDELTVAIAKRTEQIDRLLRDEFGTLAPPPPPTVFDTPSVRTKHAQARIRHGNTEARRREYEALSAADLQALIDGADAKLRNVEQEHAANMHAWRDSQWPAWAKQDLWSEAEFAAMCCGLTPNEGRSETLASLVNQARETISRGVLVQSLAFVARADADNGAMLYGTARHFVPAVAAEWATSRFSAFPANLLAAVRERGGTVPTNSASAASKTTEDKGLSKRERNNLLRIIRALDAMNAKPLPKRGYAESVLAKIEELGLTPPSDDTIRKVIEDARSLDS